MTGSMAVTTALVRPAAQRRRKKGLNPETAIQIGIMNYLKQMMVLQKYQRFMAFHVPNGGQRGENEARLLRDMGVMPGVADIVVLVPSLSTYSTATPGGEVFTMQYPVTIFLELKHQPQRIAKRTTAAGRAGAIVKCPPKGQHNAQELFQHRVKALGFDYRVVSAIDARDGLNQVVAILAEYGVKI